MKCLVLLLVGVVSVSAFKVAVYEHEPVLPPDSLRIITRKKALDNMAPNRKIYTEQAKAAAKQGVQLIVFPEDGLHGFTYTRKTLRPYAEDIPDPTKVHWTPCDDPDRYGPSDTQTYLSCLAKTNNIYLVANMVDEKKCSGIQICNKDGFDLYNTDVVFDQRGKFIARYHKSHLFAESQFTEPAPDMITFQTPLGVFGIATCYDLLFEDPLVGLIRDKNITNLVVPTAWMRGFPHLTALNFADSFARGFGVNLVLANIHLPKYQLGGSGVFNRDGALVYYYDGSADSGGKLLVADIQSVAAPRDLRPTRTNLVPKYLPPPLRSEVFQVTLNSDKYNFVLVTGNKGKAKICMSNFCCYVSYNRNHDHETFALGAFSGLHTYMANYEYQTCLLLRCAGTENKTCGQKTSVSTTTFSDLKLSGNFDHMAVLFPQVSVSTKGELGLAPSEWSYHYGQSALTATGMKSPVVSASIFARIYSFRWKIVG